MVDAKARTAVAPFNGHVVDLIVAMAINWYWCGHY